MTASTAPAENSSKDLAPARPNTASVAVGALVGALAGAALAHALTRRSAAVRISSRTVLKAGVLLLGTMRQLAALLAEEEE